MISLQRYIYQFKDRGIQNTSDSVVQVRTFINFWTFFDTRRERQFLKSLSYHTMLTKLPTAWSDPKFSTPWSDPNFNCLPKWQRTQLSAYIVQNQLPTTSFSKSSNSQDHRFRAWRHSHSSSFPIWGYYDNCDFRSSLREHQAVPNVCVPELRAE